MRPAARSPSVVTDRVCGTSVDLEAAARDAAHGQADAVERHRSLFRDEARERGRRFDRRLQRAVRFAAVAHAGDAVHVTGDQVPAERAARGERRFEVDGAARHRRAECRARERLAREIRIESAAFHGGEREADARDRNAVADPPAGGRAARRPRS